MLLLTIVKGFGIGILIAAPIGPVGVICIRRTVLQSLTVGMVSGFGAAIADSLFGVIAGFGLTYVQDWMLGHRALLGSVGGVALLAIGLKHLFSSPPKMEREDETESALTGALSCFALTITNPITILAFAALFTWAGFNKNNDSWEVTLSLVGGVFMGSLAWWAFLTGLSSHFSGKLKDGHIGWLNRGSGAIIALSGIVLFATTVF